MSGKQASLFISETGQISLATFLLMLSLPFFVTNRWWYGLLLVFFGFLSALCNAMTDHLIEMEDKSSIRYNNMEPADISDELELIENEFIVQEKTKSNLKADLDPARYREIRIKYLAAMEVLAKKYGRSKKRKSHYHPHEIELICQEIAYGALKLFGEEDEDQVVASALSLFALVAKDSEVRQRNLYEADKYGLNVPVQAMRKALRRIANTDKDPTEHDEHRSAELQRKGCLLLGALADGEQDLATKIVDEEGLDAILDALDWYRYHEDVANWALWSCFILCLEHPGNKAVFLQLGGVQKTCQAMENIPDSLEVARHGIAVLFDLLRLEQERLPSNILTIRKIAVGSGLHKVLRRAMENFPESMECMMMGQEMLVATGYRGDIPQYKPTA